MISDPDPAELLKFGPRPAVSLFSNANGSCEWKECNVLSYDEERRVFLVEFLQSKKKEVKRLNLIFSFEEQSKFEERRQNAFKKKKKFHSVHQLEKDVSERMEEARIKFPEVIVENIVRKYYKFIFIY